jgi:hypothetical protein
MKTFCKALLCCALLSACGSKTDFDSVTLPANAQLELKAYTLDNIVSVREFVTSRGDFCVVSSTGNGAGLACDWAKDKQ